MHVEHADGDPLGTDPIYHEAWFITADSTGNFTTSWYVPSIVEGDAYGATLLLTAHGYLRMEEVLIILQLLINLILYQLYLELQIAQL